MTSLGNAPTMYRQISGKHCSGFGNDDYTSHGGISTAECKAKCDQDERCVVYASKENEWCTTYEKCVLRTGTQWGGSFFQHKVRPYAQISGKHCSGFGNDDYTSHGGISTAECKAKCDEDERCIVYASKENEWCTTYEKCIFKEGTQWGGSFFQHKVRPYTQISGKHCSGFGKDDYTSHGGITTTECKAKCDQDERCVVYASKENEWCTTYEKCVLKTGTQWGGSFFQHMVREQSRLAREKEERERLAREAKEKEERERLAREAKEKEERERLAREAKEKEERERLAREAKEKEERERLAREAKEKEEEMLRQFNTILKYVDQDKNKKLTWNEISLLFGDNATLKQQFEDATGGNEFMDFNDFRRFMEPTKEKEERERLAREAKEKEERERLAREAKEKKNGNV